MQMRGVMRTYTRTSSLARAQDRVGVEAVVAVEVGDVAGLAEGGDAERRHGVAVDGAEPREREGVAVEDGDEAGGARHIGEKLRDVRGGAAVAPFVGEAVVRRHLRRRQQKERCKRRKK